MAPTAAVSHGGTVLAQAAVPPYQHIFVIMEENHAYGEIIGNPDAPNLNSLAQTYGLATDYSGVTHPSEPNYVAAIGGSNFQVTNDDPYTPTNTVDGPSLASQLDAAGLSWKAYEQSLPYAGFTGFYYPSKNDDLYASKHDPFLNFLSVQQSPTELQKIVPDTQLQTDLQSGDVPAFGFVTPDICHDMHGGIKGCPGSSKPLDSNDLKLISAGDTYAGNTVSAITGAPFWSRGNNAIVITWDEGDGTDPLSCCDAPGGGHVAAIVITSRGPRQATDGTAYNHYSLLRTIQDAFGLGCLQHTCDTTNVPAMAPLFATSG